jgi:hypothetical protein
MPIVLTATAFVFCDMAACSSCFEALPDRAGARPVHPILKSSEQDNETGELNKAQEVLGMILPSDEDAALPLNPGKEAFDEPAPHVAAEPPPILGGRLAAVGAVRRNHFDAASSQLLV